MESFDDFVQRFRGDTQKRCGHCYSKKNKIGSVSLYKYPSGKSKGVFAYVHETKDQFKIATWLYLAERAAVQNDADKIVLRLMFGEDGCWFYVSRSNDQGYQKAVTAISKIYEVKQ